MLNSVIFFFFNIEWFYLLTLFFFLLGTKSHCVAQASFKFTTLQHQLLNAKIQVYATVAWPFANTLLRFVFPSISPRKVVRGHKAGQKDRKEIKGTWVRNEAARRGI